MQGWRMSMEDSHISIPDLGDNISLFAVFDGHGGAEVAKFCSDNFAKEFVLNANYKNGNYGKALQETFLKMDEILMGENGMDLLRQYTENVEMTTCLAGCTANVVLIVDKKAYVANAGDSRCISYTNDNKVIALSKDHKPDDEEEKMRIVKAGGYVSNGRINDNLNLSRAIGDLEYKKNDELLPEEQIISAFPDIVEHSIEDQKFFIIGCDGIWETKTAEEICETTNDRLKTNPVGKVSVVVEELLDMLIAKETTGGMGCDNMSCIIVQFKQNN
jgi:serine/threonine protein phosphatase PrpC